MAFIELDFVQDHPLQLIGKEKACCLIVNNSEFTVAHRYNGSYEL